MDLDFTVVQDAGRAVWRVLLDPDDIDGAEAVGLKRHQTSQLAGEHPAYGCKPEDAAKIHKMGACCEWAAAKALQLPMPVHINTHGQPDLPPDIQVRGTTMEKDRIIRVFKRDQDGQRYLLVRRVSPAVYHLMGWCPPAYAKNAAWWGKAFDRKGSPDCWRVPEAKLWAMATFDWPGRAAFLAATARELTHDDIKW